MNNYTYVYICHIYCTYIVQVLNSDLWFQSYNVRDVLTFFMLRHCKAKKVRCGVRFDVEHGKYWNCKNLPSMLD